MGQDVSSTAYTREDRQRYREKVRQDLDVFEEMLERSHFDFKRPEAGLEIELNLVDESLDPAMCNAEVLERIGSDDFQTELGRYNIELNVPPRPLPEDAARLLETHLVDRLTAADSTAEACGARVVSIGILPTLMPEHFDSDWISQPIRYTALNNSLLHERGEGADLDIEGPTGERLAMYVESIGPASACTSVQLHQLVTPQEFPLYWNAAQAFAGVQLAVGANSPFLFGKRLWAETRIELFTQMIDTRSVELKNQTVRPRAFFGRRWITSIFDLFEENVRSFPALLPEVTEEDPVAALEAGEAPALGELRLHNGTVYRWNRPIYDTVRGTPHLRVENRVLPAGPSVIDMMANTAFYYGLLEKFTSSGRPIWTRMPFDAAEENFFEGARMGIDAILYWPGQGRIAATDLVRERLIPLAHEGLERLGIPAPVREHFLSVIEQRCVTRTNGASWQVACVEQLEEDGADRLTALHQMLERYVAHMRENIPVHTWTLPHS